MDKEMISSFHVSLAHISPLSHNCPSLKIINCQDGPFYSSPTKETHLTRHSADPNPFPKKSGVSQPRKRMIERRHGKTTFALPLPPPLVLLVGNSLLFLQHSEEVLKILNLPVLSPSPKQWSPDAPDRRRGSAIRH